MTEISGSIDQIQVITAGEQGPPGTGIPATVNAQTGTSYIFALSDNYGAVTANNAAAQTYTIPSNEDVPFMDGSYIDIYNLSASVVTLAIDDDTLHAPGGIVTISIQFGKVRIQKLAPTLWVASGDLS